MNQSKTKKKTLFKAKNGLLFLIALSLCFSSNSFSPNSSKSKVLAQTENPTEDYGFYQNYQLCQKYEKREIYKKYKRYKELKDKYAFESKDEKRRYKSLYNLYKKYKKKPKRFPHYAQYKDEYRHYRSYKNEYLEYKKYAGYADYEKYNKDSYADYKQYCTDENKAGYERYKAAIASGAATDLGEADLGGGALGPEISVGLWSYTKNDLKESYFRIKANKDYSIKDKNGTLIATIPAETSTRVKYVSDKNMRVYESVPETLINREIFFEAADGNNTDLIFDLNRPGSSFDRYRGKIKLRFFESSNSDGDRIWVINTLPLEQYIWGMGEIIGDGDPDHNKVMTTAFRTYGYWKIKFSTKYAAQGFKVDATSSSQIYYGYDWEEGHPNIKTAAEATQGKIVMHRNKDINEIAITPYSSWTDGRTRSFEERWGSKGYPWCQSVPDPYGKHPTLKTEELERAGNHMVGLSARGSVKLASEHDWSWERILNYYFDNINIIKAY